MPRAPRQTAGGIYHITARAAVGERLFRDEHDYVRFETELGAVVARQGFRCIAACVLTTHYHLLVETEDGALARAVGRLNYRYARAFNSRYGRRGHAFAERYLSVPIADDEQLLTVYRYVARNPVQAGLCEHPRDWPWSSYAAAIGFEGRFAYSDPSLVIAVCDDSLEMLRRFVEIDSGA